MAELEVDTADLLQASKACDTISMSIRSNIDFIQRSLDNAANWKGAAAQAVREQFAQQRPVLNELERLLLAASSTTSTASHGFSDHDTQAASGVGGAAAHAGNGATSALRSPLNV